MHSRFLLLGVFVLLVGCTGFIDFPDAKQTTGRMPTVAEVPAADETVRGESDPPIVTLKLGSKFKEKKLNKTDALPGNIIIPNTNLTAVPVTVALEAVLDGTDVSLSWDTSAFDDRLVSVTNLSGPLPNVVDKICKSAKVFCSYRHGLMEIKAKETFIIELPSMPSVKATKAASNSMAEMISSLAGETVRTDPQGGKLVYTTDVDGQQVISEYLKELRHGRSLVVLQLYIWEVTLSKDHATGINWSSFQLPDIKAFGQELALAGSTAFSSITSPGVSLGATLQGDVDADSVLEFLATQGQVQTISNPQLTFVSGSNAEFRVGGTQRYISEVGESSSSSVSTSSTSSTVTTDEIETGLTVKVGGSYENGVVSAAMELEMEDVVDLNPTEMENGTIIDLPETTERSVNTSLRVRPGDNLVLAGLVSSRDTNDREGVPFFGSTMNTYKSDELENSELVILVKPSIVKFADEEDEETIEKEKAARFNNSISSAFLPAPILIDKDGAKTVNLPGQEESEEPQVKKSEEVIKPLSVLPVAPSQDAAPVDKSLMQRGFSYAYDEMLLPQGIKEEEGAK